jgi:hypothetical protein
MLFALTGLAAAQAAFAQAGEEPVVIEDDYYMNDSAQGQHIGVQEPPGKGSPCQPSNPPGKGNECGSSPPPVCPQPECPDGKCSPPIKPGECWSQCIIPAKFQTVRKPVKICEPCPTPGVRQSGTKTVSQEVDLRKPSHGYRIPGPDCSKQRVAGKQWVKVADAQYGKMRLKKCVSRKDQVLMPTYRTEQQSLSFSYTKPVGLPGQMESDWITVPSRSSWEHLYRKATPCPPNGSGMSDCSAVCSEMKGPQERRIRISRCKDKGKGDTCKFTEQAMPPLEVPYNVEVGIPPQLPPSSDGCTTEEITVMIKPPVYDEVNVMESVCESGKPKQFPVPGRKGTVSAQIPVYEKTCKPGKPVYDCVTQEVQACRPALVWRQEAICQSDGKSHSSLISQVQNALVQAGYPAGPADGSLNEQTRQAIWKFQGDKGLAVGGTLTKETLEALGIYQ